MENQDKLGESSNKLQKEVPESFSLKTILPDENGVADLGPYRDEVVELYLELFANIKNDDFVQGTSYAIGTENEAFVLSLKDEQVAGFGMLAISDTAMSLDAAYVRPEYRQKGIYKQLVEERINVAKDLGATSVSISPNVEQDFQIGYLESKGFVLTEHSIYILSLVNNKK